MHFLIVQELRSGVSSLQTDRKRERRRVLQAAVGLPVVFTLPSGAALAAVSVSCDVKGKGIYNPSSVPGVASTTDTWMRYRLPQYSIVVSTAGADQTVFGILLNGTYYQVNANGSAQSVTPKDGTTPAQTGTDYFSLVDYSRYPSNDPASYIYPGVTTIDTPIAGSSCWNSLLSTSLNSNVIN